MALAIKFVKSAVKKGDYPLDKRPEVAIVGRSNAGKSSLINALAQSRIAKISQTPGKTTLLNFFMVSNKGFLVDMPGYGYAQRSHKERESWREMIEGYLNHRKNLRGLILVMDIRRDWSEEEVLLHEWSQAREIPFLVVLNKLDKVGQSEKVLKMRSIRSEASEGQVFCVSAKSGKGLKEFSQILMSLLESTQEFAE